MGGEKGREKRRVGWGGGRRGGKKQGKSHKACGHEGGGKGCVTRERGRVVVLLLHGRGVTVGVAEMDMEHNRVPPQSMGHLTFMHFVILFWFGIILGVPHDNPAIAVGTGKCPAIA